MNVLWALIHEFGVRPLRPNWKKVTTPGLTCCENSATAIRCSGAATYSGSPSELVCRSRRCKKSPSNSRAKTARLHNNVPGNSRIRQDSHENRNWRFATADVFSEAHSDLGRTREQIVLPHGIVFEVVRDDRVVLAPEGD